MSEQLATRDVVVATGAGISAESGVPTFRDANGLWQGRRPEDVATPEAFERDPRDVWSFYYARRGNLETVIPNPGHRAIAAWQGRFGDVPVITQNIDGLHRLAGSRRVLELHGDIWRSRCLACRREALDCATGFPAGELPRCACGGLLRPAIVWFGESLPEGTLDEAFRLATGARTLVVVGTSNLVYPAAGIPMAAIDAGVEVIEVNPEPTPLTARAARFIQGKAAEILPTLF